MIGSLLVLSMLTAQPAEQAAPDPVATEAEAEVQVQVETPVVDAEINAEAEAETTATPPAPAAPPAQPAVQAAAEAETETAAADPQEEVICRRRLRPSERIGQRHRIVEDCRTRSEWESVRRRR